MRKRHCDRCKTSLKGQARSMSIFNCECLCTKCKSKEKNLPLYKKAVEEERQACLAGNYNFPGIGLN